MVTISQTLLQRTCVYAIKAECAAIKAEYAAIKAEYAAIKAECACVTMVCPNRYTDDGICFEYIYIYNTLYISICVCVPWISNQETTVLFFVPYKVVFCFATISNLKGLIKIYIYFLKSSLKY
eukprot:COSAG06_NODE_692_length_13043_cov_369.439509_16_plen_123_part_00